MVLYRELERSAALVVSRAFFLSSASARGGLLVAVVAVLIKQSVALTTDIRLVRLHCRCFLEGVTRVAPTVSRLDATMSAKVVVVALLSTEGAVDEATSMVALFY